MKKTVIYCRVSTREQVDYGYSIRDQEDKLVNYCKVVLGIKESKLVIMLEEGASAGNLNRPKMQELLKEVKKKRVETVVIHNLDRMFRNMKDFIEVLELFENNKVELVSLREKIETHSAMGRFQISFFVLMAEWERNTIRERTIRGLDRSAKEGNYARGGTPLGYDKINKKLVVNPKEERIISMMFESIASGEKTVNELSIYLKKNYSSERGWGDNAVRKILNNKIYIGTYENERTTILNHSPAIISSDLFEQTQEIINKRKYGNKHFYLAKDFVKCEKCKVSLSVESAYNKSKNIYKYYSCKKCKGRVSEIDIERLVSAMMRKLVQENITIKSIDIGKFEKIAERDYSINQKYIKGIITESEYLKMSFELQKEKESLMLDRQDSKTSIRKFDFSDGRTKRFLIKKYIGTFSYSFAQKTIDIIH